MTLPIDRAYGQVSTLANLAQIRSGGHPLLTLTLTVASVACAVSRFVLCRRLAQGAFPHAARDADGAWNVPVGDLLAAGLRVNAPRVSSGQGQSVAVSMFIDPVHRPPASAGEQAHVGKGERVLAIRVVALGQAPAVGRARREGAERLAAE